MTAMVRKPILMPDELIELVNAVASAQKVPFAEAARQLIARGAKTPTGGATNPFGMDDDVLEGLLDMAIESANHSIQTIDDLLATLEARNSAAARVSR